MLLLLNWKNIGLPVFIDSILRSIYHVDRGHSLLSLVLISGRPPILLNLLILALLAGIGGSLLATLPLLISSLGLLKRIELLRTHLVIESLLLLNLTNLRLAPRRHIQVNLRHYLELIIVFLGLLHELHIWCLQHVLLILKRPGRA